MDSTRWLQLKSLFREAFDLPAQERAIFLQQRCPDASLRHDVEELLREHDRSPEGGSGFPPIVEQGDAAVPDAAAGADTKIISRAADPADAPGGHIGPYKLLQQIGAGGFGAVFMAEQEYPLRRRVALKIIKPGMDSKEVVARFEQERQALALMDHPHIARVVDGGATPAGRPYFVMELVRGVPATEYCDTNHLRIAERLELFLRICEAVQHAHQKGVIHRDLKPSNVLVSTIDGRAHPRVIDFGIAKALREPLTNHTLFTNFHQMVGTPQYMSPEQASGNIDIDTRSDVYSLGVLLYELLTGTTPFDVRALRSMDEIQRAIREVEPPRPSTRLQSLQSSAARGDSAHAALAPDPVRGGGSSIMDIARQRRTDAPALLRQVRGDLDWIVMRALEKDRARRFESVGALAGDVQRYLRGEPVLSGPPTRWYRASRFVRRHRLAVFAGMVAGLSVLAGAGVAVVGLVQAVQARDAETAQRDRAERGERAALAQASRADQISSFLKQTLLGIDPVRAQGRDTKILQEVLAETEQRLQSELADQPATRADLLLLIARVNHRIGQPNAAQHAQRACAAIMNAAPDELGEEFRLNYQLLLANVDEALGDYDAAMVATNEAIALSGQGRASGRLDALQMLATLQRRRGAMQDALSTATEALRLAEAVSPPNPRAVEIAKTGLAAAKSDLLDHVEAERLLREVLASRRATLGEEHFDTIVTQESIAIELHEQRRFAEAAELGAQVVAAQRRILGDDHLRVANTKVSLGITYMEMDKLAEARTLFEEAIPVMRRAVGGRGLVVANALVMLGQVSSLLGQTEAARDVQREAVEILERTVPERHPALVLALDRLARTLDQLEDFEAADAVAQRAARASADGVPGMTVDELIQIQQLAAGICGDWGQAEAARGNRERALELIRRAQAGHAAVLRRMETEFPARDWRVIDAHGQVGTNLILEADVMANDPADASAAVELLRRAEPLCRDAATTFLADDSILPDILRRLFVTRAVQRMALLFEVWERVDHTSGGEDQLRMWRERLADTEARFGAPGE